MKFPFTRNPSPAWTMADAPCMYPLPVIPGALRTEHVGSRVTCRPAPTDTDDDYLVLVKQLDVAHEFFMRRTLFGRGGSVPADMKPVEPLNRFHSYKHHELNIIVTESPDFFCRFMLATRVATKLNLLHKVHRIDLFQAILYGNCL